MSEFITRPVVEYDLPLPDGAPILHPEQVILRFGDAGIVDIGALCFLRREVLSPGAGVRKAKKGRKVAPYSFNSARAEKVRALIAHISQDFSQSGRREITIRTSVNNLITFIDWTDANEHFAVLDGEKPARAAMRAFTVHLKERMRQNYISVNSAAHQQSPVIALLEDFLGIDDMKRGLDILRQNHQAKEPTAPPCEEDQSKVLSMCEALFDGLTELVLDAKPYPFRLSMPKYLAWADDGLWIFPTTRWSMPPHLIAQRHKLPVSYWVYDYTNGRLATLEELRGIESFACGNDMVRRQVLRNARLQLEVVNADPNNINRRRMGVLAHNVFALMFVAQTGMNTAQAVDLPWSGEYEVGVVHQVFRAIKWRAGNREVNFEIPVNLLPRFKQFLELRAYLLDGIPGELLFFRLGRETNKPPKKLGVTAMSVLFKILRHIDPQLPTVMPRQWRAAKSDWLIRNTDPSTAAIILQNSERTVLQSYAAGSEITQMEEMTNFLDHVSDVVVNKGQIIEHGVDRAVGVCSSFGKPHQMPDNVAILPDCKSPEGCLFCDKFKVHADEHDTRKLLSCRYCLHQTAYLVGSEERFQILLSPILGRIQLILDEISRYDEKMVNRIAHEVTVEGELDPYWAGKLEMLMDLDLVV